MMGHPTLLPDAVQWSEGMLLSPQHMQQNDIYWHEHLRHRLSGITPHFWGVSRLELDASALVKGSIVVKELECVLPEGLAVSFPGSYPAGRTLDIDVDALVKRDGRPVRVWLQVKERGSAAARADNADRRYDSIPGEMTPDENTGDGAILVARLQPHIALYAGDATKPAPAGRGACPLFDLVRDAHGHLRIAAYHPPMLRLDASAFLNENALQRLLNGLMQRIWTKLEELADSGEDSAAEDDSPAGSPHLRAARLLAKTLPQLEIAAAAPHTHPETLYRALAHMAGEVSGIGANPLPLKMKPYRHEDCLPLFQTVFDYIDAKLALLNTAYECLQFVPLDIAGVGPVRFARSLSADMSGEIIIELKPKDGQSGERFLEWLNSASIVSDSLIHTVEKGRLRGATIHPLSAQEIRERGLRAQAHLFRLESRRIPVDGKGMQAAFQPGQVLLIHGPETAFMPVAIVLHREKARRDGRHGKTSATETLAHA